MNKRGRNSRTLWATAVRFGALASLAAMVPVTATRLGAQTSPSVLTSRAELMTAAEQAENSVATSSGAARTRNQLIAATIRQRLTTGDFLVGDRIVLSYISDIPHSDTLVVRSGPTLPLPASASLSLAGVLMSLYPAATVLLAIVVLRERVTRWQAVGMVLALASVAMIAAG